MRAVIFGDSFGINQLIGILPVENIVGVVASTIRPGDLKNIFIIANKIKKPYYVQPKYTSKEYLEFKNNIEKLKPNIILVNSYSLIIRKDILSLVDYNAINIHYALLPKNRGCNPTQWAIIKGEIKTGITIHYIDEGIDSGNIIAQAELDIDFCDTWLAVNNKLITLSFKLLREYIPKIISNSISAFKQDEEAATYNKRLDEDFPKIDFTKMNDIQIYNLIRAQVKPLKGAYIEIKKERIYFDKFVSYDKIKEIRQKFE